MLKAIAFDLWETLITNNPEVSIGHGQYRIERLERVLMGHGHAAEAAEIERAYRNVWHRCQELYWSADIDIPCRRQIEVFVEELGVDPAKIDDETFEEMERVYANAAVDLLPDVVPGARELLGAVRERGLRTGLISNTGRTPGYALREILDRLELSPYIDAMVFSNEHGACKPQPSIFEQLRSALGVRYDEMLFIGDNLYVDVYGAKRCGMTAVHFQPPVRGTAVAPAVEVEVEADATVSDLRDLLTVLRES
ncbi:MAG TPA: HAD family hydrolase [Thermoanaerobaculia bacterium]|nr:HAD family hydrolase [Thermoanaerobaculia bacterium]